MKLMSIKLKSLSTSYGNIQISRLYLPVSCFYKHGLGQESQDDKVFCVFINIDGDVLQQEQICIKKADRYKSRAPRNQRPLGRSVKHFFPRFIDVCPRNLFRMHF